MDLLFLWQFLSNLWIFAVMRANGCTCDRRRNFVERMYEHCEKCPYYGRV